MPQRSSSTIWSRSVAMRAGARSGLPARRAKKSRGWGSNVSTQAGTPRWRASLHKSASIAWWPRCTPSKLPMVSAVPPLARAMVARDLRPRWICISDIIGGGRGATLSGLGVGALRLRCVRLELHAGLV